MINKRLLLSFLSIFIIGTVYSQNHNITGVVLNVENNRPIEFANIGIENTYLGTATNINGEFELIIPLSLKEKQIRISAVGYKTKSIKVQEWIEAQEITVKLNPINYGLSEVNIEAESKIGYGIIKSSVNSIEDNYLQQPYLYKCYLKSVKTEGSNTAETESILKLTDKQGYVTKTFTDTYKDINYQINENITSSKVISFIDGLTRIDDLLTFDIVRSAGNILSENTVNDYKIKVLGKEEYLKENSYIIEYETDKPNINNCGDPEAIHVKGKLWISVNSNAVLKNECTIKRNGDFIHGRSFNNPQKSINKACQYTFVTTYIKDESVYRLDAIDFIISSDKNKEKIYLKVIEKEKYDPSIVGRTYFNYKSSPDEFWKKFTRPN